MSGVTSIIVMLGLGPSIHDFFKSRQVVDGRAEPGHDVLAFEPEHDGVPRAAAPEAIP